MFNIVEHLPVKLQAWIVDAVIEPMALGIQSPFWRARLKVLTGTDFVPERAKVTRLIL